MATNVVLVVIRFSKYENFFISQLIVIKLRIPTDDNIIHNRTVWDFQVKSQIIMISFELANCLTQQHQHSAAAAAAAALRGRVGRHLANTNDMRVPGSTTATRCCSCYKNVCELVEFYFRAYIMSKLSC